MSDLQATIDSAWENRASLTPAGAPAAVRDAVAHAIAELDAGRARVAEKVDGRWVTHQWLKKAVLLSFRLDESQVIGAPPPDGRPAPPQFYDKVPSKFDGFTAADFASRGFRVVPP